ncbi:MAG: type II CRISPR RNA-guided endonuclease Cas9 [Pseudomonadota bacterium]
MPYRLGLDIGTNSIGGWLLALGPDGRPAESVGGFVRIFSDGRDPKTGASLAEDRRLARAMRRRRDRYLRRRTVLLEEMIAAGLMPADEPARKALEGLDPFALRTRALDAPLTPGEIGRALFHLNQRRGFRSNRKTDRRDNEAGKIETGIARLDAAMAATGARTFGEFLQMRQARGESVRARLRPEREDDGRGESYDFYPDRLVLEQEFYAIWTAQAHHHPDLMTDALRDRLFEVIFFQRPLKEPKVGRCLYLDEPRLGKRHPLFQRRRLYETVNALRIERTGAESRPLTRDERDKLILHLRDRREATFKALAKTIRLDAEERFSLQSERRPKLEGDALRAELGHKDRFGPAWNGFDLETQVEIVERLHATEDSGELHNWLTAGFGLEEGRARGIAAARLPEGYGRIGLTATREILAQLEAEVIPYSTAVERAPSIDHHSDFRTGEVADRLPYYGIVLDRHVLPGSADPADPPVERFGRLSNPTVHIGLGQLRRVVNAVIERHGPPAEIVVELARELKLNERQRRENDRRLTETTKAAQVRSALLRENDIPDTGANRLRLRLWEDLNPKNPLDRRCVYTGEQIGVARLFSNEVEIDHILPYSRTLDDSPANRMLILREANRIKRNRAPFEAFGHRAEWDEVAERASRLPKPARWRFAADAMERFEAEGGFEARQLTDIQHLARLARQYLEHIAPDRVTVTPGRLTEMLRRHWGLNSVLGDENVTDTSKRKNRLDHRHHAIDAAVVAATDRALLQRISREAGRRESEELDEVVGQVPPPFEAFRDTLRTQARAITVSHKQDRGRIGKGSDGGSSTTGRLHNDTAYGLTGEKDERGNDIVVRRLPVTALTKKHLAGIRDPRLRTALLEATGDKSGKELEAVLRAFSRTHPIWKGIRRVRVSEPLSVIPIRDKAGRAYKAYKGDSNHAYEIWQMPDGKWVSQVIPTFDANQPDHDPTKSRPHPAARKIMTLHRNDAVAYQNDDERRIARVVKFSAQGQLVLADHEQAGDVKRRHNNNSDPFRYTFTSASGMKKLGGRLVRVDEIGRVLDPGPNWHAR